MKFETNKPDHEENEESSQEGVEEIKKSYWKKHLGLVILLELSKRVKADDRFISEYVEGISVNSIDSTTNVSLSKLDEKAKSQYVHEIKTGEYWAEIHRAYTVDKEKLKNEHPKDFEIVQRWIETR